MKGLIIKDLLNMKKTLKLYLLLLVFYGVLSFAQGNNMLFGYFVVLLTMMMSITALSYDEKANWDKYALSMPVSRTDLVMSKYVLSYGCLIVAIVLAVLYMYLIDGRITQDGWAILAVCTGFSLFFTSIMLPVMFKFGCEKGRIAIFAISLIPVAAVMIFNKANLLPKIDEKMLEMLPYIAGVIVILMSVISMFISVRIYKNKEF